MDDVPLMWTEWDPLHRVLAAPAVNVYILASFAACDAAWLASAVCIRRMR